MAASGSNFARDIRTVPNLITLSRIVLIIAGGLMYFYVSHILGIVVAVIAGITDYLDGVVARATGQVTRLGEILDQTSDLCFESLMLVVAISSGFYPPFVMIIYLLREFWVSGVRRFMSAHGLNIPSSFAGKLKTNFIAWSMLPTFLSLSDAVPFAEPWLAYLARFGLTVGLIMSYVSGWKYTTAFVDGYNKKATGPEAQ